MYPVYRNPRGPTLVLKQYSRLGSKDEDTWLVSWIVMSELNEPRSQAIWSKPPILYSLRIHHGVAIYQPD
jgi:hypothetical protein